MIFSDVLKKNTLIFHEEEKSFRVFLKNFNSFLHHLSERRVCGTITIYLVPAVFGLKQTCRQNDYIVKQ